jgi:hypothetical protein
MRIARRSALFIGVCLVTVGTSRLAAAQITPKAEVSGGYQLLDVSIEDVSESLATGWYVDVAGNLNRYLGIVAAVGGNYKSIDESASFGGISASANLDVNVHEFMGGVRVSSRANRTVVPFGQVLAGAINGSFNASGSATVGGTPIFSANEEGSGTDFAWLFGGGVNIGLTERVGVRVGADYLRILSEDGVNAFRFTAGVTVPFTN